MSEASEADGTSWARLTTPRQHPSAKEAAFLVVFSALLHTGVAFGFYGRQEAPRQRPLSKVEIELSRPPPPRKQEPPKPPPPRLEPPKPPEPKKLAENPRPEPPAPREEEPAQEAPAEAPTEVPIDTGSSAPSAADGTLYAGRGGLGLAPPAPRVPAHPPPPPPIIQAREGANYKKNPRPAYPRLALREGWEGTVGLRVQVLPSGRPGLLQILQSSGRKLLDEAALEAVKKWTFAPSTQGGKPISGWVTVPIVFKLQ